MTSDVESEILSRALQATSRRAAIEAKADSHPLHDPALAPLARLALTDALGPPRTGTEPFPLVIWQHGAFHTGQGNPNLPFVDTPGIPFTKSIDAFVKILHQRARVIAPKRRGWVVEASSNPTGIRTNDHTEFMHAVFLDADHSGPWEKTLAALAEIGLAYVAHQSGGYTPTTPKWRVILPLASSFPVSTDAGRAAWKAIYHRIRVLVGALGQLTGEGFDPSTDGVSAPFFLCERRDKADPPREVIFRPGASLDLVALSLSLPDVPEEVQEPRAPRTSIPTVRDLDDEAFATLVKALAAVTESIPRGRRDLYLALPGALLDRGVTPEDVTAICAEVSLSYPRRYADKHADNVHNCATTIQKFLAKDPEYTRIGTLQGTFPDVAAVLDRLVPDLVKEALDYATLPEAPEPPGPGPGPEPAPAAPTGPTMVTASKRKTVALRKKLVKLAEAAIAEEKEELEKPTGDAKHAARIARNATAGRVLVHSIEKGIGSFYDVRLREKAVVEIFNLVGFDVKNTIENPPFDEIAAILGITTAEDYATGAKEFAAARGKKVKWEAGAPAREAKRAAEKKKYQEYVLHYLMTGEIKCL